MPNVIVLARRAHYGARLRRPALHAARALAALLSLATTGPVAAQSLAQRVEAAGADEAVHFSFESRPEVCGDGESIMVRDERSHDGVITLQQRRNGYDINRGRAAYELMLANCRHGPVTIELTRAAGRITTTHVTVAATEPARGRALGTFTAAEAVAYLLDEAVTRADHRAAERVVFAATLANAESWPRLLRNARNRELEDAARNSAIFWLSQAVGAKATEGLVSLIGDDSDELDVRKHAIFALAQIKSEETIDALIKIARTSTEPGLRRDAIFWLGQTRHPRAIAFFEEILKGNQ